MKTVDALKSDVAKWYSIPFSDCFFVQLKNLHWIRSLFYIFEPKRCSICEELDGLGSSWDWIRFD